jgi:hypothetical protein
VALADNGRPRLARMAAGAGVLVTLAAVACAITLLFLGVRSLLEIGGSCAGFGPFDGNRPCPDGVPLAIAGGIVGGLACAWINIRLALTHRVGSMLILVGWPGLFLSLAYNFVDFGVDPTSDEGVVWPWLLCGGLFGLVGAAPLMAGIGGAVSRNLGHGKRVLTDQSTDLASQPPSVDR